MNLKRQLQGSFHLQPFNGVLSHKCPRLMKNCACSHLRCCLFFSLQLLPYIVSFFFLPFSLPSISIPTTLCVVVSSRVRKDGDKDSTRFYSTSLHDILLLSIFVRRTYSSFLLLSFHSIILPLECPRTSASTPRTAAGCSVRTW